MSKIKFTVEYFEEGDTTPWRKSGIAVITPYPAKIADLTPNNARVYLLSFKAAQDALMRQAREMVISAGILTKEEVYKQYPLPDPEMGEVV